LNGAAPWQAPFLLGAAVVLAGAVAVHHAPPRARCGPGFITDATRCNLPPFACPSRFLPGPAGCLPLEHRVRIPAGRALLGPSDWEAEGLVAPHLLFTAPFDLDAFEVTESSWSLGRIASARAASAMTWDEADQFCKSRLGRLPTDDEWTAAAIAGHSQPVRYPWGDTGAVCRRGAWGLQRGPCAWGADGPDTVGAHADGDSTLGLHDMAGNVAEWVSTPGIARGGSWQSRLATELRTWSRLEVSRSSRDPRVGVRCAYDVAP
jgi:formylglycine-generating enzyme required for sulfatase activity